MTNRNLYYNPEDRELAVEASADPGKHGGGPIIVPPGDMLAPYYAGRKCRCGAPLPNPRWESKCKACDEAEWQEWKMKEKARRAALTPEQREAELHESVREVLHADKNFGGSDA